MSDLLLDANTADYIATGTVAAETAIGPTGTAVAVPGWATGRAIKWSVRCATASAVGLRYKKDGSATFAAGPPANYEDLAAGEAWVDEAEHAGACNQSLRIGPAAAGVATYTIKVVVRLRG